MCLGTLGVVLCWNNPELLALQGPEALTGHAEAKDAVVFLEQLLEQGAFPCP